MSLTLITLIGHQPLPTLLILRHFKPDRVVFLSSGSRATQQRLLNLDKMLRRDGREKWGKETIPIVPPSVDPWDMRSVLDGLGRLLRRGELGNGSELLCDVTGGTKPMSLGLARFAEEQQATVVYVDSESADARLWTYRFAAEGGRPQLDPAGPEALPTLLTVEDMLFAYLGHEPFPSKHESSRTTDQDWFARDVARGFQTLQGSTKIDELRESVQISGQEEIDIILRRGNRFAIVECKWLQNNQDGPPFRGIHQLNNAASDRYLGVYTGKIYATRGNNRRDVRELAEQHDVQLLELPEWTRNEDEGFGWQSEHLERFEKVVGAALGRSQEAFL